MDTRTGEIHQLRQNETIHDLYRRALAGPGDLVMLDQMPDAVCRKCHGRGSVPKGIGSRKFKPCECTQALRRAAA